MRLTVVPIKPPARDSWLVAGEAILQYFEFADEATAEATTGTVNATGTIIDTKPIAGIEPPPFYRQGKLIVLYPAILILRLLPW